MLVGLSWFIDHLRQPKRRGNTAVGRAWTARVRAEKPSVDVVCDTCGTVTTTSSESLKRVRHVVELALQHETKWGVHCCRKCADRRALSKGLETRSDPEWQTRFKDSVVQGMAAMGEEAVKSRNANLKKGITEAYRRKSPEERRIGVQKQWQTMTSEVKKERAKKIGVASHNRWEAMTPEEKSAAIAKQIKGLPRSKISDRFRQALIDKGLYDGFVSEKAVSGFTVDECNEDLKVIIEFFGDYYHCNPAVPQFADPNFNNRTIHMTSAAKWRYDESRLKLLRKAGYQVLVVWELDWRTSQERVLEQVKDFLRMAAEKAWV